MLLFKEVIKVIEKIKNKFINKQFLSFGLIGAFNTIAANIIYMFFIMMNITAGISSLMGDMITVVFSYFLNMKFTYHLKPNLKSFIIFPVGYFPGFIINMIITIVLVDWFNAPELFAKAFSLPITIPVNYIVISFITKVTKKKEQVNETAS